jgi:hypothetical protein
MVAEFIPITPGTEDDEDTLYRAPYEGVKCLYDIDAIDKASAVPYIKLQQVDRATGSPVGSELNLDLIDPPAFGKMVSRRFAERPDVSLESITVKQNYSKGWWIFSEITISLTVHRPEALQEVDSKASVVARLIQPGSTFVLVYGWQGGKNPVLGLGYNVGADEKKPCTMDQIGEAKAKQDLRTVFPAQKYIRFCVTTYNFEVEVNGQIHLTIQAIEDGETHVRASSFFNQMGVDPDTATFDQKRKAILNRLDHNASIYGHGDGVKRRGITVKKFLDAIVAGPLTQAYQNAGYSTVKLKLGMFNGECPETANKDVVAGKGIADFVLDYAELVKKIDMMIRRGEQLTLYNFIETAVVNVLRGVETWRDPERLEVSVPDMVMTSIMNPQTGSVEVFIIDRHRYLKRIREEFSHSRIQSQKSILKKTLKEQRLFPVVSIGRAQSFLQASKFEAATDDQLKSILVSRSIKLSRTEVSTGDLKKSAESSIPMALLMYRSALRGTMSMIGNFVFNTFGMLWIDFGVDEWSGMFYVVERSDKIDRSGFQTNITVMAEGWNPLNAPTPKLSTPNDVRKKPRKLGPATQKKPKYEVHDQGATAQGANKFRFTVREVGTPNIVSYHPHEEDAVAAATKLNGGMAPTVIRSTTFDAGGGWTGSASGVTPAQGQGNGSVTGKW